MKRVLFVAIMTALVSGPAMATLSLPGTGGDSVVPVGIDDNYRLYPLDVPPPADVPPGSSTGASLRAAHSGWYAPDPGYSWIGPTSESAQTAIDDPGYYWFKLDLGQQISDQGGFNAGNLYLIEGDWATDNSAAMFLNGSGPLIDLGITREPAEYDQLTSFAFTATLSEDSTLLFRVLNDPYPGGGYTGANPVGLLVQNLTGTLVPLPGAVLLGMLGLAAAGRKLRKMC